MSRIHTVLTGDLVGSRQLSPEKLTQILAGMRQAWNWYADRHKDAVTGEMEVYRGDGWQVALRDASLGIEAATYLRAAGKAFGRSREIDSRIGLGIGRVETINPNRLGESQGPAFILSGQALESLGVPGQRWALRTDLSGIEILDSLYLPLLDLQVTAWSPTEAAAILGTLLGWKQENIAKHPLSRKKDGTSPTQQAIGQALQRTAWQKIVHPSLLAATVYLRNATTIE